MKTPAAFAMKEPCADCPFRVGVAAIGLRPGRLAQIARDMVANDRAPFVCHKAAYHPKAKRGHIAECRGAQVWLWKNRTPNVPMRLGFALGYLTPAELEAQADMVVGPIDGIEKG